MLGIWCSSERQWEALTGWYTNGHTAGERWIGGRGQGRKLGMGRPGVGCEAIQMRGERVQRWLEDGIL